jgi:polysaccharide biosynthesis/export protein
MRLLVGGTALLCVWLCGVTSAQPTPGAPDVPSYDARPNGAGTKIPVTSPGATEVMDAENTATSSSAAAVALEQPIDATAYTCGPGDTFELNFWGQQNFRLKIAADLEGRMFISKVGFVSVAGKTLSAVRVDVNKKVRANYPGLKFELTLVSPRSFVVHVANNVKRPGAYASNPLERVSSVLAHAGGTTGSRRLVSIKRKSGDTLTADLLMYELTGETRYNPNVLDGDVITVPFAEVVADISGAVRRPGTYELIKTKDLAELLELAGGFTSAMVRTLPIRVIRRDKAQHERFIEVPFGSSVPNHSISDADRVVVRGSEELQRTIQLIGAVAGADSLDTATEAKRLPFVEGDTLLSLIDRAGGIKAHGDLSRGYISRPTKTQKPELIPIDLERLLVRRDFTADRSIQIGDVIVIPPTQYSVRVEGAVARAGMYPFNPRFGIAEYIAHAGGRTRTARGLDEVKIIDRGGRSQSFQAGLKPLPGDAILVPERNFTRPEIAQIALSAAGLILSGVAITLAVTR